MIVHPANVKLYLYDIFPQFELHFIPQLVELNARLYYLYH